MAKLSRMDKYREVRSQIEETNKNSKAQEKESGDKAPIRLAAPDTRHPEREASVQPSVPVIDDVIGEVKQYNLENGELVTEDTQMQILYDLSENRDPAARRKKHLETMESNEAAGGTTLNIYASGLEKVPDSSRKPARPEEKAAASAEKPAGKTQKPEKRDAKVVLGAKELEADPAAESDQLDLFAAGNSAKKPVRKNEATNALKEARNQNQKKAAAKAQSAKTPAKAAAEPPKAQSEKKKKSADKPAHRPAAPATEEEEKGSKAGSIVIGILIVVLIVLICLVLFWMKKVGIFG